SQVFGRLRETVAGPRENCFGPAPRPAAPVESSCVWTDSVLFDLSLLNDLLCQLLIALGCFSYWAAVSIETKK
ncbi:MAG: hypothetical protein LJE68_15760, partial [Rhodobacter sp.]|nr:hypothetical protein [Rhodobacter sp.]